MEIKICGMTNRADAEAALAMGADYVGVVLHPASPRYVSPGALRKLAEGGRPLRGLVGVFVNRPRHEVETVAADCGLVAVQLHGDEAAGDFMDMPLPVWRAIRWRGQAWQPAPEPWTAARLVVDAAAPGSYGGSGTLANWEAAERLARTAPVLLAGGLTPDNVADAIRRVRPLGVDVVSGVEQAPGCKDHVRMAAFIKAARSAPV